MDYQCLFENDVLGGKRPQNRPVRPNAAEHNDVPNESHSYSPYTKAGPPRLIRLMRFVYRKVGVFPYELGLY
jgi:hypothetical protein